MNMRKLTRQDANIVGGGARCVCSWQNQDKICAEMCGIPILPIECEVKYQAKEVPNVGACTLACCDFSGYSKPKWAKYTFEGIEYNC